MASRSPCKKKEKNSKEAHALFTYFHVYICMLRVACLFIHVCTYTYMYMGIYPRSVTSFYSLCSKHQSDPLKQINYVMLYTCLPWWPLRKRYPHQSKGLQTRNLFCIKFVLFLEWLFFIVPYCLFKYNTWCNTWCQINCFQVQNLFSHKSYVKLSF